MDLNNTLRIGTRGSELALWQARWVQRVLAARWPGMVIDIDIVKTTGDRILDAPLATIGDRSLFTREIEQALLDGAIDLAVHSLKDLPTELPAGLTIGAIPRREDVRDVFIPRPGNSVRTLLGQPPGATIATGSLRRQCQILSLRPDFAIVDVRGNLHTRMKKLEDSTWAGMLLARAGLVRLGWEEVIGETLSTEMVLPAVGQGALGIEVRAGDSPVQSLVEVLADPATAQATRAERALMRCLEGGCQVPIGAYGRIEAGVLKVDAMVGSLDGRNVVRGSVAGDPEEGELLGVSLARQLLRKGADRILDSIRSSPA